MKKIWVALLCLLLMVLPLASLGEGLGFAPSTGDVISTCVDEEVAEQILELGETEGNEIPIVAIDATDEAVAASDTTSDFIIVDGVLTEYTGSDASVTIPEGVIEIGGEVFRWKRLTEVTFPKSLKKIEDFAFADCANLKRLVFPSNVEQLCYGAFINCTSLSEIVISGSVNADSYVFDLMTGEERFSKNMARVTISDGGRNLDLSIFDGFDSLKEFFVTADNPGYSVQDGVLFDKSGEELIKYPVGRAGTVYTVPDSVRRISPKAFCCSRNLKKIIMSNPIENIDDICFTSCNKLEEVVFPEGVTRLANGTFYNCRSLKHFTVPMTVTNIGEAAFVFCPELESIIIPPAVMKIGKSNEAFCFWNNHENFAIYGEVGSYAETYAAKNHLKFVAMHFHTLDNVIPIILPAVAATCTEDGLTEGSRCTVCGEFIKAQKVVPATGHTLVTDKAVAATYTKTGLTKGKHCSVCGAVIKAQKVVPVLELPENGYLLTKNASKTLKAGKKLHIVLDGVEAKSYKSGNKAVATVSKTGLVKAKLAGKAKITVKLTDGKKLVLTVKVTDTKAPKTIKFTKGTKATLKVGKKLTLKVKTTPTKANYVLTWSSSNKKVATVSDKGVVKAKKAGKATITATTQNGKTATIKITVKKK